MLAHLCFGMFGEIQPLFLPPVIRAVAEALLNGSIDVAIFFILSGDALSAFYWDRQSPIDVGRRAIKRYFRLEIPIFASCLIAFILVRLHLNYNGPAAVILNNEQWLGSFLQTNWSVNDFLTYAIFGVFFNHVPERSLNPVLWTMQIELFGSMLVFLYLYFDRYIRRRAIALASVFVVCLAEGPVCLVNGSFLACFAFGMLCGHVRYRGGFAWLQRQRVTAFLVIAVAIAATSTATYCHHFYQQWNLAPIVAACILVFCIYASPEGLRIFRTPFSRWLGRISFPLYLVHFSVIVTVSSGAVVLADSHGALGPIVIWSIILGSAACSVLAAVLFEPVEQTTAWLIGHVYRTITRAKADGRVNLYMTARWRRSGQPVALVRELNSDGRHLTNDSA
jgi:peptidoglycan/LPS O-acetylase OafA/YrhL